MIDKPGIYEISEADYHADPCPEPSLSSSVAKVLIDRSPLHAMLRHPRLTDYPIDVESNKAMRIGEAAHAMFLDGNESKFVIVEADNWRTKDARMTRDLTLADNMIPLLSHEYEQVNAIHDALKRQVELPPGKPEQTVIWQDEGIWCRARVDWFPTGAYPTFYDLKCTDLPATPEGWGRNQIWEYAMQWGLYGRGVSALTRTSTLGMSFVVQEMKPPYECSIFELDDQGKDYAEQLADAAINLWADCLKRNHWPGYPKGPTVIETPAWIHYRAAKLEQT